MYLSKRNAAPAAEKPAFKMDHENTIRDYIRAYNAFDVEGMMTAVHEKIHFENIAAGQVNLITLGKEEFRKQAEKAREIFREREQRITRLEVKGDHAEVEITYTGVLAMDLPNGLKAGDRISLQGRSLFWFKDGRIIELKDIS
jgi:hypothetical protein